MTRDEEIFNAIDNLQIGVYDENNPSDNDEYDGSDIQDAFYLGARWADENPKSPWISVEDDLPCNHSVLVLTYNNRPFLTLFVYVITDNIHTLFLCNMKKSDSNIWIWNYSTKDKITHWMPIPELPK